MYLDPTHDGHRAAVLFLVRLLVAAAPETHDIAASPTSASIARPALFDLYAESVPAPLSRRDFSAIVHTITEFYSASTARARASARSREIQAIHAVEYAVSFDAERAAETVLAEVRAELDAVADVVPALRLHKSMGAVVVTLDLTAVAAGRLDAVAALVDADDLWDALAEADDLDVELPENYLDRLHLHRPRACSGEDCTTPARRGQSLCASCRAEYDRARRPARKAAEAKAKAARLAKVDALVARRSIERRAAEVEEFDGAAIFRDVLAARARRAARPAIPAPSPVLTAEEAHAALDRAHRRVEDLAEEWDQAWRLDEEGTALRDRELADARAALHRVEVAVLCATASFVHA